MAYCYYCGEEIEFINNGFGPIPIHSSGSCSGRGGYGGGRSYDTIRTTSAGEVFEFPFVTYPSYVNPNARCPVCDASVYFYQSPYGGRVFFDELGPPWPKHPCTDHPSVRHHFASPERRARFLTGDNSGGGAQVSNTPATLQLSKPVAAWSSAGWMPFVVTKIVPRRIGIEAKGKLFLRAGRKAIAFRILQTSADAQLYRARGEVRFGFSLVQNTSVVLSALNESPVLLKKDPDFHRLTLSSFILTPEGEVEEITLTVIGVKQ